MMNIVVLFIASLITGVAVFLLVKTQKPAGSDALGLMQQQLDGLRGELRDSLHANAQLLQQQLGEINSRMNQSLQAVTSQMVSSQKNVGDRLDAAAQLVADVQKNLGSLSQATQRIFEVGKDIASLQEILQAPKLRGGLGELFLADLLQQILPSKNVTLQYKFKNGDTVDAVIRLGQGMVSVDSKFPLENFRRVLSAQSDEERRRSRKTFIGDVKKHIDAIAAKYIVPDEGTFDFALMYIPAENVYYEVIIKDSAETEQSVSAYALQKKVIPVSPNSFYAYLQAIVLGLKGLRVEENVQHILQHLTRLGGDIRRFRDDFDVLGRHVVNVKNKYDEAEKKIAAFEDRLVNLCRIDEHPKLLDDGTEKK
ncbi:MAG: DNA recombination protein RmuC [Victivallales bacterium]|nr:DNA recombination protein RmuC [Victivallales bacterium]